MTVTGSFKNLPDLDEDEKIFLSELFQEVIAPKLTRLGARLGTINCSFAGEKYHKWNIRFKSVGSDFMVSDIEFDENSASIDLDL
jgi:hypothetical protein